MIDDNPYPLAFALDVRRRRRDAGLSQAELARRIHYTPGYLCKIESGDRPPTPEIAKLLDDALGARGRLAELARPRREASVFGESWSTRMADQGSMQFSVGNPAHPSSLTWSLPPVRPDMMGAALPFLEAVFTQARTMGQRTDPGTVTQLLLPTLHGLRSVASNQTGQTRVHAARLAARYAEYLGWMTQELSDDERALWWTKCAAGLAAAGDDGELAAFTLVRQAEIAIYRGDAVSALALAEDVLGSRCGPRVRSFAAQRQAQAFALMGSERACRIALEAARDLDERDRASGDEAEPPGGWAISDHVSFAAGWCLLDLGYPGEAVELLRPVFHGIPGGADRARTRCAARLAVSLAELGDTESAVATMAPLLPTAHVVNSATVRYDLRRLWRVLAPRGGSADAVLVGISGAARSPGSDVGPRRRATGGTHSTYATDTER